jgi:hypothetical protein
VLDPVGTVPVRAFVALFFRTFHTIIFLGGYNDFFVRCRNVLLVCVLPFHISERFDVKNEFILCTVTAVTGATFGRQFF